VSASPKQKKLKKAKAKAGRSNYHIGPHRTTSGDIGPHSSFTIYRTGLNPTTSDILSTTSDLPNKPNKF